jgi:hypothetical protein
MEFMKKTKLKLKRGGWLNGRTKTILPIDEQKIRHKGGGGMKRKLYTIRCHVCGEWLRNKDPVELSQILINHYNLFHKK